MASGPDHMRASASSEPLVDREWQATTAVAALTSALDEPHAVAQPAEHVVSRRDSPREEREGMSEASVGIELPAPPAIAVATNSSSSSPSAYELQRRDNIRLNGTTSSYARWASCQCRQSFRRRMRVRESQRCACVDPSRGSPHVTRAACSRLAMLRPLTTRMILSLASGANASRSARQRNVRSRLVLLPGILTTGTASASLPLQKPSPQPWPQSKVRASHRLQRAFPFAVVVGLRGGRRGHRYRHLWGC